eukprot:10883632-Alexandrium_andersonii.AAC.1
MPAYSRSFFEDHLALLDLCSDVVFAPACFDFEQHLRPLAQHLAHAVHELRCLCEDVAFPHAGQGQ